MIPIDKLFELLKETQELIKKRHDRELSDKVIQINEMIIELQNENETLRRRIKEQDDSNTIEKDLELTENGWYIKKNEQKDIKYCASCFQNSGKLYSLTNAHMNGAYLCTNCHMPYKEK